MDDARLRWRSTVPMSDQTARVGRIDFPQIEALHPRSEENSQDHTCVLKMRMMFTSLLAELF